MVFWTQDVWQACDADPRQACPSTQALQDSDIADLVKDRTRKLTVVQKGEVISWADSQAGREGDWRNLETAPSKLLVRQRLV